MSSKFAYFKNNLAAESLRLWSVRSSWFFAACNVVGVTGISLLAGSELGDTAPAGGSPWMIAGFIGLPALFGCLVLFSIAATADYSTKSIIATLQWTPQRGFLLAAKTITVVFTATLFGVLLVTAAASLLWLQAPQLLFFSDQDAGRLGSIAFVYATSILLTVGLAFMTRNTAATLATVFGLILVLPLLLQILPFEWVTTVIEFLPGTSVLHFLIGESPGATSINNTFATLSLLAWSLGAFTLGGARFLTDDAN